MLVAAMEYLIHAIPAVTTVFPNLKERDDDLYAIAEPFVLAAQADGFIGGRLGRVWSGYRRLYCYLQFAAPLPSPMSWRYSCAVHALPALVTMEMLRVRFLLMGVLFGLTLAFSTSALAARGWGPPKIEIECISSTCLPIEKRAQLEGYANEVLAYLKTMSFLPPMLTATGNVMGDFAPGRNGQPVIRMYYNADQTGSFATAQSPCRKKSGQLVSIGKGEIVLGPKIETFQPPVVYWFIAHEMFHTLQYSQTVYRQAKDCRWPQWLGEGTANAIGLWLMEKHFGSKHNLPSIDSKLGIAMHGLRVYHVGLATGEGHYKGSVGWHSSESLGYKTSSFWRYLAERYHNGNMDYLSDWMKIPYSQAGSDDWLAWLDERLQGDAMIDSPLYVVFPDFQANFATWAPARYDHIKEQKWLKKAYRGCETITLTPRQPVRGLLLDMEAISSRCLRVKVTAIDPQEVVSVKLMAMSEDSESLDNLHIGAATLSPIVKELNGDFNCYRDAKAGRGKLPWCLDKPFIGKVGDTPSSVDGGGFAKTWLNKHQVSASGQLENLYIITHAPLHPHDAQHANRKTQQVQLRIGLAKDDLKTSEKGKAKKANSVINGDAKMPIPMRGSEELEMAGFAGSVDFTKQAHIIGINPQDRVNPYGSGIGAIQLIDRAADDIANDEYQGALSFTISPLQPIPFGARGKYPAKMTWGYELVDMVDLNQMIIMVPSEQKIGEINVKEFSEDLLHLDITGYYCRIGNLDKKDRCKKIESIQATVIRPFGWAYDAQQKFTSIDTPGMAVYRRILGEEVSGAMGFGIGMPAMPGMPSATGASGSDGKGAGCSCTCTEFEKMNKAAERLDQSAQESASGIPDLANNDFGFIACFMQCAAQYEACQEYTE
jgi:hypothetical protein